MVANYQRLYRVRAVKISRLYWPTRAIMKDLTSYIYSAVDRLSGSMKLVETSTRSICTTSRSNFCLSGVDRYFCNEICFPWRTLHGHVAAEGSFVFLVLDSTNLSRRSRNMDLSSVCSTCLYRSSLGPAVFRGPRNFEPTAEFGFLRAEPSRAEPSRGIYRGIRLFSSPRNSSFRGLWRFSFEQLRKWPRCWWLIDD